MLHAKWLNIYDMRKRNMDFRYLQHFDGVEGGGQDIFDDIAFCLLQFIFDDCKYRVESSNQRISLKVLK